MGSQSVLLVPTVVFLYDCKGSPRIHENKLRCFFDSSRLELYMATIFFWRNLPYWPIFSAFLGVAIYFFIEWAKDDFAMEYEHISNNLCSLTLLSAYFLAYILLWGRNKQEEEIAKRFEIEQIY